MTSRAPPTSAVANSVEVAKVENAQGGSNIKQAESTDLPPHRSASPPLSLPEIPNAEFSLEIDLPGVLGLPTPAYEKMQKRASNVLKLTEENEKLKAELKAMTDRLEAAERQREELRKRMDGIVE